MTYAAAVRVHRAANHLTAGTVSVRHALENLNPHRTLDSSPELDAARTRLLRTLLDRPHLVGRAAAARADLVVAGTEPAPPPPDSVDVLTYARHAYWAAHADLTSPRRRVQLAVNRWLRSQPATDRGPSRLTAARAAVAAAIPGWDDALTAAAAALDPGPRRLRCSAPGRRLLPATWPQTHPRHVMLRAVLADAFGLSHDADRSPLIDPRHGGAFELVVPGPWAWWLSGPARALTVTVGDPVDPVEVPRHALALRLWGRGDQNLTYADALEVAGEVLWMPEPARSGMCKESGAAGRP